VEDAEHADAVRLHRREVALPGQRVLVRRVPHHPRLIRAAEESRLAVPPEVVAAQVDPRPRLGPLVVPDDEGRLRPVDHLVTIEQLSGDAIEVAVERAIVDDGLGGGRLARLDGDGALDGLEPVAAEPDPELARPLAVVGDAHADAHGLASAIAGPLGAETVEIGLLGDGSQRCGEQRLAAGAADEVAVCDAEQRPARSLERAIEQVHHRGDGAAQAAEGVIGVEDRDPAAVDFGEDRAVAARHRAGGEALERAVDADVIAQNVLAGRGGRVGDVLEEVGGVEGTDLAGPQPHRVAVGAVAGVDGLGDGLRLVHVLRLHGGGRGPAAAGRDELVEGVAANAHE